MWDDKSKSWVQRVRDIGQLAVGAMVAVLFIVWVVFGAQTIQRQNTDILRGFQVQLETHAAASASRSCALARELEYLATHSARVNGTKYLAVRPPQQIKAIHELKAESCALHDIPGPGGS